MRLGCAVLKSSNPYKDKKKTTIACAAAEKQTFNTILIGVDTLRKDYVGTYNPERRKLTPNIDALLRESVVFDNAYSVVPITLPSFTSVFTSLYPIHHGIHFNTGFKLNKQQELYDEALIVFFSDHGEGLGEHDEQEHGYFLFNTTVAVPLAVKLPKSLNQKGVRSHVAPMVTLMDIYPTVCAIQGWQNRMTRHPVDWPKRRSVYCFG